jgi:hypothetical protein
MTRDLARILADALVFWIVMAAVLLAANTLFV